MIKIADYLGVSTDFFLGQTDFPACRNYVIEELGLSYKAAMALYTREVDTDVVNRILENPKFPESTRMTARYFKDATAECIAGQNAMWDTLRQLIGTVDTSQFANPQEGIEAITQILGMLKTSPYEKDEAIQAALMDMLRDIKAGIQTQTPTTELATRQITRAMMESMTKGGSAQPLIPQITLGQLAVIYSTLPGATPELGGQFAELIENFIKGYMDIARKQGLTNDCINGIADK